MADQGKLAVYYHRTGSSSWSWSIVRILPGSTAWTIEAQAGAGYRAKWMARGAFRAFCLEMGITRRLPVARERGTK